MKKLIITILSLSLIFSMITVRAEENKGLEEIFQQKHRSVCEPAEFDLTNPAEKERLSQFDEDAGKIYDSMIKAPDRQKLWEDMEVSLDSKNHYGYHGTFTRILTLAKAYQTTGSRYYHSSALKQDIISAMEFMRDAGYNDTTSKQTASSGNWYYWEISVPQSLVSIMFYMRDELPGNLYEDYISAMKYFMSSPQTISMGAMPATGANLAWKCNIWIKLGVIHNEEQMVTDGVKYMDPLFKYAEELHTLDGFYPDGSFIQHDNVAYNGGYGSSHVGEVLQVVEFLDGTQYAFPPEKTEIIGEWVINGLMPLLYNGNMMDMVRGREIARQTTTDRTRGLSNLNLCFRAGLIVPQEYKVRILSEVRYQLESNPDVMASFRSGLNSERKKQLSELMEDPQYAAVKRPQMKIYNGMSKAVYKGTGFALGISMFSDRIKTHEYHPTEYENKHAWFTSHGATYLYNDDSTQFSRNYYPTVDPYMIPGITRADSVRNESEQGMTNSYGFAGGASLEGQYGCVGLRMADWPDQKGEKLEANKSYFCFDDQIIAVGLVDTKGLAGKTVIENRIVNKGEAIVYDNKNEIRAQNTENRFSENVYIGGNNNTGYVLGKGMNAVVKTEERSGAWSDISEKSYNTSDVCKNEFMQIYINHEPEKPEQRYEYVLLPGRSKNNVMTYDTAAQYRVLENTKLAAGIISLKNNMEMINFWGNEEHTTGSVTAKGACSVIVKEADGLLKIAVADPTTKADEISLKINKAAGDLVEKSSDAIKISREEDGIYITINTRKKHADVFEMTFQSDTSFVSEKYKRSDADLIMQSAMIFQPGNPCMLSHGEKTYIYPENKDIAVINKDGTAYVPLRTLALIFGAETVYGQDGSTEIKYEENSMMLCGGSGRILINGEAADGSWIYDQGAIFVPLRLFIERMTELEIQYEAPIIIADKKASLEKWDSDIRAAAKEIMLR
ncbi:MAG: hypothetical protein J6N52_02895 [Clostridia bacterium]|nr:hypothetical protein [Clostridia bacterium]